MEESSSDFMKGIKVNKAANIKKSETSIHTGAMKSSVLLQKAASQSEAKSKKEIPVMDKSNF